MSLDTIELETSGKWEKIEKKEAIKQLEDIKDVKKISRKTLWKRERKSTQESWDSKTGCPISRKRSQQ